MFWEEIWQKFHFVKSYRTFIARKQPTESKSESRSYLNILNHKNVLFRLIDHSKIRRKKNHAKRKKRFPLWLLWKLTHRNNTHRLSANDFFVWWIWLAISISLDVKSHRNAWISLMPKTLLWVSCWKPLLLLLLIVDAILFYFYVSNPAYKYTITKSPINCVFVRWFF